MVESALSVEPDISNASQTVFAPCREIGTRTYLVKGINILNKKRK